MVEYVTHMGDDDTVCNAARVSFDKTAEMYTASQNHKLICYLAKHNHWSPFSHCTVQMRFTGPIFIARQLAKHQVGFAWNEVSRRYVDSPPSFWSPPGGKFRLKADNAKQGYSSEHHRDSAIFLEKWNTAHMYCELVYRDMIYKGVCPEQARAILPQSMMTQWVWTGSLYAWSRMYSLRIDSHAQAEVQDYARQVDAIVGPLFPLSWAALKEANNAG